ncbi:MAG: solute carrier family 23 protein [Anaerococcus obesiensis]
MQQKDFIILELHFYSHNRFSIIQRFLSTIPILIAIVVGYICSVFFGMVDLLPVLEAKHFYQTFQHQNLIETYQCYQ